MDVDAVAFDVDGTLYPNSRMYLNSVIFSLGRLRFLFHFRTVRRQIRQIRPLEDFRLVQARMLANRMSLSTEEAKNRIDHAIYYRWQRAFRNIRPYPHLVDLLLRLHDYGYSLGVMSDFPVGDKLANLDLPQVWDRVLTSEATGYLKPNPEPFYALASSLDTTPERVLYVGNSYEYDIVGASKVGMKTAHLARVPVDGSVADVTFSDYRMLDESLLGRIRS